MYLVIFYHYAYYTGVSREPSLLWNTMAIVSSFIMPYFYIISGALYRPVSVTVAIKKGWTQLLKPYLLINMLVLPLYTVATGISLESIWRQLLGIVSGVDLLNATGNWATPLWFCFSLFFVKVLYSLLYSLLKWVGIAIGCAVGISIMYVGNILPLLLDTSLVGFVFFAMGHVLSRPLMNMKDTGGFVRAGIILAALVLLAIALYLENIDSQHLLIIRLIQFGPYPLLYLLCGFAGTIAFIAAATFIPSGFAKSVFLTFSNGLIIVLGFHGTVYHTLFSWWLSFNNTLVAAVSAAVVLMLCYPLILLAAKYWPSLMGNRRLS